MGCGCSGSNLTAILEEKHLHRRIVAIIKPERPVASDVISAHAATRAPAVYLMNAEPVSSIERAPGFDHNSPIHLCFEHRFQSRSFHLPILDQRGPLQFCIVQA